MDEWLKKIGIVLGCAGLLLCYTARILNADKLQWPALLIAGVGIVLVALSEFIRRKKNAANPITTVCVSVLGRRTERHGRYQSKIRYFLSFRPVKGGARLEFEVPWEDFDTYHEDDIGVLRYRTWEYLSFSRGENFSEEAAISMEVGSNIEMQEVVCGENKTDGILTHELEE